MAFTRIVDRVFDEALLHAAQTNIDGDYAVSHALPAGFGDCALLEAYVVVTQIATLMASPEIAGPGLQLLDSTGSAVDTGFCGRWQKRAALEVAAWAAPDQVQLWKQDNSLRVSFPEIDTNGAPTADLDIYVKVRRLRPDRQAEAEHFFLTS